MAIDARAWFFNAPNEPLVEGPLRLDNPGKNEVIVAVKANGLCHTDLGFLDGSVKPNHALPLVLGHEAVGEVIEAGVGAEHLLGHSVVVPAVLPCGECDFCDAGRGNACLAQKMPGNDIHGAFATHMLVPSASLISLEDAPADFDKRTLSVVADAVSTAYQAGRRANLSKDDVAIVIGAGGVGGFLVQVAAAKGAKVIALDTNTERLEMMRSHGADECILLGEKDARAVRKEVKSFCSNWNKSTLSYRIFECAGVPAAQQQAFTLIGRGSVMVQVGFSPQKVELRLSNLMAFDATVHGTWGCPPEVYPEVLSLIYSGKVKLDPFVDFAPLSEVNQVLSDMRDHKLTRRVILTP
ncbi:MAG: 6-hydroxycyclohex-1-ene-1-carbonyl-CoA dehydrogenase [Deltaproteobacteria bacterium]|nr:6-hydroxycyclohex-1-ene-1-carbonyl-CoA dehydrogenase [Deltaproteobacteria bacterium]